MKKQVCLVVMFSMLSYFNGASCFGEQYALAYPSDPRKDGEWTVEDVAEGKYLFSQTLTVKAKPEPTPALSVRFIDDPVDQKDWNAAVFYLKAIGFPSEDPARIQLNEIWKNAAIQASNEKRDTNSVKPFVWENMNPKMLPIEEVKEYLELHEPQFRCLDEAQQCKSANFERHLEDLASPISVLLPEVSQFRNLCRSQLIRCRLAIAENRIADAIAVLRQQFSLAYHVGNDQFIVSNLVGISIAKLALDDCLRIIEHDECPNLYWAYATLPKPLVTLENSLGFERRLLLEQVKLLKEVDLQPREEAFWDQIMESIASMYLESEIEGWSDLNLPSAKTKLQSMIDRSLDQAKEYLKYASIASEEQLQSLAPTHLAMLALVTYYRERADNMAKWAHVPYHQLRMNSLYQKFVSEESNDITVGELTQVCNQFLVTTQIYPAQAQVARKIALLQTIEAVRMYAAEHDGALPESLDETPVPAVLDPVTGKHFEYKHTGNQFEIYAPPSEVIGMKLTVTCE